MNPNNVLAYVNRGNAYYNLNQYNKALADFNKALQLNPNLSAEIYYKRGKVYEAMGDNVRAQADFNKAKQLGYNG